MWENRAFGKSVGDGIRAYTKDKNIKLIYDEGYDQLATDMTPIVQKLKDVRPDILIAISFPNDAILFQRKAKELDFDVAHHRRQRRLFVSGFARFDRRMRNGIFVSDFPPKVNPKALKPETNKIAEEFYKRYEAKMQRPPAGHASAGFSAIWALFTEVFPKAKTFEPDELREIASKLDLPEGSLVNGSGIKFTNIDWRRRSEGCRTKSARLHRRLAMDQGRATSRFSAGIWRPSRRRWCHCRRGASADAAGTRERLRLALLLTRP